LVRIKDPLRSERLKLKRQMEQLERKFEAKSLVLSKYSEDKKLERAKKDFQQKHEMLQAEIDSIDEEIKKEETERRMQADVEHKRDWERIKSELMGYPDKDFREFMKQFAKSCIKLKRGVASLDELFHTIELPDETIRKSIQMIRNNGHEGICGIRIDYDFIQTRFARELSEI